MQQIAMIHPKLVCTLGNWATQTLLERKVGITKVRGQAFYLKDFVLFPLLHPAAAFHQGNMLEPLREDFKKLREFLDRNTKPPNPRQRHQCCPHTHTSNRRNRPRWIYSDLTRSISLLTFI